MKRVAFNSLRDDFDEGLDWGVVVVTFRTVLILLPELPLDIIKPLRQFNARRDSE